MKFFTIIAIFLLGLTLGIYVTPKVESWQGNNYNQTQLADNVLSVFPQSVEAKDNPASRIPESAISVLRDRVTIDVQDAQWATFTDTHSMEPVIFQGSYAIEVVPKSVDDIKVGDIVSYKSQYADGTIIHRVVYKGTDDQGTYFVMKGDNLPTSDPGRIRFSQMQRVVVAIIY